MKYTILIVLALGLLARMTQAADPADLQKFVELLTSWREGHPAVAMKLTSTGMVKSEVEYLRLEGDWILMNSLHVPVHVQYNIFPSVNGAEKWVYFPAIGKMIPLPKELESQGLVGPIDDANSMKAVISRAGVVQGIATEESGNMTIDFTLDPTKLLGLNGASGDYLGQKLGQLAYKITLGKDGRPLRILQTVMKQTTTTEIQLISDESHVVKTKFPSRPPESAVDKALSFGQAMLKSIGPPPKKG